MSPPGGMSVREYNLLMDSIKKQKDGEAERLEHRGRIISNVMPSLKGPIPTTSVGRMSVQMPHSDKRFAVDRDIAWLYPKLMQAAFKIFDDPQDWKGFAGNFLRQHGVTVTDMCQVALALKSVINNFHSEDSGKTPDQAFNNARWGQCKPEARLVAMARIGEVFLGAIFAAVKDLTGGVNGVPPNWADVKELSQAAETFARNFNYNTDTVKDNGDGTTTVLHG